MAERAKPLGARQGAGFRPAAMLVAVSLTLLLLLLFDLVSHAHF